MRRLKYQYDLERRLALFAYIRKRYILYTAVTVYYLTVIVSRFTPLNIY
jgi:hypothetical protein